MRPLILLLALVTSSAAEISPSPDRGISATELARVLRVQHFSFDDASAAGRVVTVLVHEDGKDQSLSTFSSRFGGKIIVALSPSDEPGGPWRNLAICGATGSSSIGRIRWFADGHTSGIKELSPGRFEIMRFVEGERVLRSVIVEIE
jgi:hypothetical protein